MPAYETLKHRLTRISNDAERLLDDAVKMTLLSDDGLSQWKTTCRNISEQLSEEIMRVAVVGAIKSGKSTFANTLLMGDYLKRGAGVVTSIVTRVRSDHALRASLYLKNWDEVNRDIDQASVLLPAQNRSAETQAFDIRREKDRRILSKALESLAADQLITNDTRNAGSVLLASYLKGYDRVKERVKADHATVVFQDDRFPLHREFVGDDALLVGGERVEIERFAGVDVDADRGLIEAERGVGEPGNRSSEVGGGRFDRDHSGLRSTPRHSGKLDSRNAANCAPGPWTYSMPPVSRSSRHPS